MSAYKRLYKQLSALIDRLVGFGAAWLLTVSGGWVIIQLHSFTHVLHCLSNVGCEVADQDGTL